MEDLKHYPISISEILRSRELVRAFLKPTQLIRYDGLSRLLAADIYVKHENHNPTGTFKIRGGINLMSHLERSGVTGVITFSTGNHGLSIATSAKWFGLDAAVVVPENSNPAKTSAIRQCGAELVEAGSTFEEAACVVDELCQERGYYYAHPADEPLLINGVGTAFLEVVDDLACLDTVIVPLGAGSEAAAAITVFRALCPDASIVAVQAESSPAAYQSWLEKRICHAANKTFAGGFATGKAYEVPFEIYKDGLDDFVLLTEDEIYDGISAAFYYTHNLAEGAGAATIAAAYKLREELRGKTVVLQMSGCNASPQEIVEASRRPTLHEGYKQ
ncbi:MAG: pyridoxal-phosphate dependent enzyme [Gemmatimonadota bacterium]|nr:MAG: pyridoxal-phosphate dependent enzyme [Gemmatimonadota bacterium]